jgi:hypothetical protein
MRVGGISMITMRQAALRFGFALALAASGYAPDALAGRV